jgi:hypothetical protein
MTGAVGFPVGFKAQSPNWRTATSRAEKGRTDNDLQNNTSAGDRRRSTETNELRGVVLSQFETRGAQERNSVHHSTPFAAQIVSQMLGQSTVDASSARAAYAKTAASAPSGICFNRLT